MKLINKIMKTKNMKNAQIQKINKTCLALIMNQLKRIINYQNAQGQSNKAKSH